MQNDIVRNDGLHFGVGTNEFSYLIPMKKGDDVTYGANSNLFKVTDNRDGNWKVTLNSGADNYDIWIGDFTITYQEEWTRHCYHVSRLSLWTLPQDR